MILKGSQRGHGRELALHLLNVDDNEHAKLHELRGFVADNLIGAFKEAEAVSHGTKCQQYLFSLSLNPPQDANVPIADFEAAIESIEASLGLTGHPRAVVFHEKKGRRHAHCVWSRIDPATMRAVNLPHFKRRLQSVARDLCRNHGWEMPAGFTVSKDRDPNTFDRIEAAQAKTVKRDPKALKQLFRNCWERSDSRGALAAAVLEHGFILAQGSRRAFVAVDAEGQVYSLSRWTGAGAKALRQRLGAAEGLPTVEQAQAQFAEPASPKPKSKTLDAALIDLIAKQRAERVALATQQAKRHHAKLLERQGLLPTGLKLAWLKVTGRYQARVAELEQQRKQLQIRDTAEQDTLIARHLRERRDHTRTVEHQQAFEDLSATFDQARLGSDPRQHLILQPDDRLPSAFAVTQNPDLVLDHISDKSETFTDADVQKTLRAIVDEPSWVSEIAERLKASTELVAVSTDQGARYTTRSFLAAQTAVLRAAGDLKTQKRFAVSDAHRTAAIASKNAALSVYDASLSDEQIAALHHVLGADGFASVVGYAGAGKSTLLEAARQAWEAQGLAVYGAALSGKAADGLQASSGISARTLASLEASWANGYDPVPSGSVVVIDEVGMVGTRQLGRVMDQLRNRRCKVVLVGDPDQLQPIQAGTPFRDLVAEMPHASLQDIRRQKQDWQRAASVDLAKGHVEMAIADYADRGCVFAHPERDRAIANLVEDYLADMNKARDQASRLAMAHRRKDVFAINQGIRAGRVAAGDLEIGKPTETDHGPRAFAPGDRILITRNNAQLGVKNGMLGTVQDISSNTMKVIFDDRKRSVVIDLRSFTSLDHGYAVSVHKSQGCTVDRSFVFGNKTLDRHLTYVALTRHREAMRLYTEPEFEAQRTQQLEPIARKLNFGPHRSI